MPFGSFAFDANRHVFVALNRLCESPRGCQHQERDILRRELLWPGWRFVVEHL